MLRSGRRTRPGIYPVLQDTFLGLTLSGRNDPQHAILLQQDNSLEHNLLLFRELETVDQSTMTAEQHACEHHFITHTTQQKDGGLLLDCRRRRIPSNLDLLVSLQSEDYMPWNTNWNRNSRICTIIS